MRARDIVLGILVPFTLWAGTVALRVSWPYDIHPVQPLWCLWVLTLSATSGMTTLGVDHYWRTRHGLRSS